MFTERAKTTLEWGFLDARTTNTTGLPYSPRLSEVIYGRALKPSELGCFSSHYALWELCAQSNQPVIVFEDDVDPDWPFLEGLARAYPAYAKIDFLRFRHTFETAQVVIDQILDRKLVELLGYPRGAQGYLLTPAHAARLLKRLRRLTRPVDDEIDRVWRYGAPNLLVDPPALTSRGDPSDIGDAGRDQFVQTGPLRLAARAVESIRKDAYMIRRILHVRVRLRARPAR